MKESKFFLTQKILTDFDKSYSIKPALNVKVRPSNERTLEVELSDGECGLPEELSATVFCDYCLHKFKVRNA